MYGSNMEDVFTNPEKTVLAHLTFHHRIQPNEPAVQKIFGNDEAERRKVLTSLRDRGYIQHYRRNQIDKIEFICPSEMGDRVGRKVIQDFRSGSFTPENGLQLGDE